MSSAFTDHASTAANTSATIQAATRIASSTDPTSPVGRVPESETPSGMSSVSGILRRTSTTTSQGDEADEALDEQVEQLITISRGRRDDPLSSLFARKDDTGEIILTAMDDGDDYYDCSLHEAIEGISGSSPTPSDVIKVENEKDRSVRYQLESRRLGAITEVTTRLQQVLDILAVEEGRPRARRVDPNGLFVPRILSSSTPLYVLTNYLLLRNRIIRMQGAAIGDYTTLRQNELGIRPIPLSPPTTHQSFYENEPKDGDSEVFLAHHISHPMYSRQGTTYNSFLATVEGESDIQPSARDKGKGSVHFGDVSRKSDYATAQEFPTLESGIELGAAPGSISTGLYGLSAAVKRSFGSLKLPTKLEMLSTQEYNAERVRQLNVPITVGHMERQASHHITPRKPDTGEYTLKGSTSTPREGAYWGGFGGKAGKSGTHALARPDVWEGVGQADLAGETERRQGGGADIFTPPFGRDVPPHMHMQPRLPEPNLLQGDVVNQQFQAQSSSRGWNPQTVDPQQTGITAQVGPSLTRFPPKKPGQVFALGGLGPPLPPPPGQPPSGPPPPPGPYHSLPMGFSARQPPSGPPQPPSGPPPPPPGHSGTTGGSGPSPGNVFRLKAELRMDDLPRWDGGFDTAIPYFFRIAEVASISPLVETDIARLLPYRFEENSSVALWYVLLEERYKMQMRSSFRDFISTVQQKFLTQVWLDYMGKIYHDTRFRQKGHYDETPAEFLQRKLLMARYLYDSQAAGFNEVTFLMYDVPTGWHNLLQPANCVDTTTLIKTAKELEVALIEAAATRRVSPHHDTTTIQRMIDSGIRAALKGHVQVPRGANGPFRAEAHLANQTPDETQGFITEMVEGESTEEDEPITPASAMAAAKFRRAKRKPRQPPKGGYPFAKRDDTRSKGKLPPSPCRHCGSALHWDNDCPHAEEAKVKNSYIVSTEDDVNRERLYEEAFELQLESNSSSAYEPRRKLESGTEVSGKVAHVSRKVALEEEMTKDNLNDRKNFPRNAQRILELVDGEEEEPKAYSGCRIPLKPTRISKPGESNRGVRALSLRGKLGSLLEEEVVLRLDSGADITLLSQSAYNRLKAKPKLREGWKLKCKQLTGESPQAIGYVLLPVFIQSVQGPVLELEVEAYVMPQMEVPILLGEDFHLNYELTVRRSAIEGSTVTIGDSSWQFDAKAGFPMERPPKLQQFGVNKAYTVLRHRANKAKNRTNRKMKGAVKLAQDVVLKPGKVHKVRVEGEFDGTEETYLVERELDVKKGTRTYLTPNTFITGAEPYLPLANPGHKKVRLKKGSIVGWLKNPKGYLEEPPTEEARVAYQRAAEAYAALMRETLCPSEAEKGEQARPFPSAHQAATQSPSTGDGNSSRPTGVNERPGEDEEFDEFIGPKTAELPNTTVYASKDMESLLDVGEIPREHRDKVWEMLRRHEKAFGFDGRLGSHPAKVKIRTDPEQPPISEPLRGASPAKKQVIEEQIKQWFEQEVIEASISPWGAPVVISYRGGKPRFCIDYRKLNAVTVPDEFPIPRQSEILGSLAGSEVLSTLDALSGFTQLEMHPDEKEKTAFRSHMGLSTLR